MAESQRQGHKTASALDDRTLVLKERVFLVTFFLGAVGVVAGMFWIADGLSDNFRVDNATFITFAVASGLSVLSAVLSRLLIK